jgi:hypothetical protein
MNSGEAGEDDGRVGGRVGLGGDLGAEFDEGVHGAVVIADEAGEVAAVEGEGVGVVGKGLEGARAAFALVRGRREGGALVVHFLIEEGGFDAAVAAGAPLGGDHLVDEAGFDGVSGLEAVEVALADEVEGRGACVAQEEVFLGGEAVDGGVAGRDGLAGFGEGPFGVATVAAGGFELFPGPLALGLVLGGSGWLLHRDPTLHPGQAGPARALPANN